MKLLVVAVGRLRTDYLQAGCADYLERLRRHFPCEVVEVRDAHRRNAGSPDRWKQIEGEALRAALPAGARTVALDERGESWDSRGFSKWLGEQRDRGVSPLAFLVGGPDGLDPTVRQGAHQVWSLGKLTLPHELARLVLLEQLYRAASLLAGSPYHRD